MLCTKLNTTCVQWKQPLGKSNAAANESGFGGVAPKVEHLSLLGRASRKIPSYARTLFVHGNDDVGRRAINADNQLHAAELFLHAMNDGVQGRGKVARGARISGPFSPFTEKAFRALVLHPNGFHNRAALKSIPSWLLHHPYHYGNLRKNVQTEQEGGLNMLQIFFRVPRTRERRLTEKLSDAGPNVFALQS